MTEDVVADFTGRFFLTHGDGQGETPTEGRIIMTDRRLVLATSDEKVTVPLSKVIDVNVHGVPPQVKQFFDDTVTIGYSIDDGLESAVIESDDETVERLVALLFRYLLNGRRVAIKHPARVGGRLTDSSVVQGKLQVKNRRIEIATKQRTIGIDVANVMSLDQANRLGPNDDRLTLVVKFIDPESGLTKTTLIAPEKKQYVNLLARFLRLEYDEVRKEVNEIELTKPEKQVLVSVHATGGDIDFTNMLDGDPTYVTNVLNSVRKKNLIVENGDSISLTPQGRIVVSQRIEDVNV